MSYMYIYYFWWLCFLCFVKLIKIQIALAWLSKLKKETEK